MTINTLLIDLPTTVKGQTIKNEDDSYSVVLNAKMSHEQHLLTYAHELKHIFQKDFEKDDVQAIEKDCHEKNTDG